MFSVYVLESETDKRLYIGVTKDIKARLSYHNTGRVRSTKARKPFRLLGHKEFDTFNKARKAEVNLKRLKSPLRVRAWILA